MSEAAVEQKLAYLTELLSNPNRQDGSVLRTFHDLFQITHEGRDLPPQKVDWLNEAASPFLSAQLLSVVTKLRLDGYAFHFVALNFIEIEDVVDDLSNSDALENIVPRGLLNKLKKELLGPPQQTSPNESTMETASSTKTTEEGSQNTSFKQLVSPVCSLVSSPSIGFKKIASVSSSGISKPISASQNGNEGKGDVEDQESTSSRTVQITSPPETSEENDEIIFSQPAWLHKYDTSSEEWKKVRAEGDIKILHRHDKNTFRIVMRSDQGAKLACNRFITPEMVLKPVSFSTRSWTWFSVDFPQNELLPDEILVYFWDDDTARLFLNKVVECQSFLKGFIPTATVTEKEIKEGEVKKEESHGDPDSSQPCYLIDGATTELKEVQSSFENGSFKPSLGAAMEDESSASAPRSTFSASIKPNTTAPFASMTTGFNHQQTFFSFSGRTSSSMDSESEGNRDQESVKVDEGDIIFSQQAMLSRLEENSERKQRVDIVNLVEGEIKILYQHEKNTFRVVMRSDKGCRLACNHEITPEMVLKNIDSTEYSWSWHAMDLSGGALLPQQFWVIFWEKDYARLFFEKFVECQSILKGVIPTTTLTDKEINEGEKKQEEGHDEPCSGDAARSPTSTN